MFSGPQLEKPDFLLKLKPIKDTFTFMHNKNSFHLRNLTEKINNFL